MSITKRIYERFKVWVVALLETQKYSLREGELPSDLPNFFPVEQGAGFLANLALLRFLAKRLVLSRWLVVFFLCNALAAWGCSFIDWSVLPEVGVQAGFWNRIALVVAYEVGYAAQVFLLFMAGCVSVMVIAWLLPVRALVMLLSMVIASGLLFGFLADATTYHLYRFHYASVGWAVYKAGAFAEVLVLGKGEQHAIWIAALCALLIEGGLSYWIWRHIARWRVAIVGWNLRQKKQSYWRLFNLVMALTVGMLGVDLVCFMASARDWPIAEEVRSSLLKGFQAAPYLTDWVDWMAGHPTQPYWVQGGNPNAPLMVNPSQNGLHYPLASVVCKTPTKPLNVIVIGIDTWRFDAQNRQATPNIADFSRETMNFTKHYSGGNCTQPGLFSLFYGVAPTEWSEFLNRKQGPVLMQALQKAGYQIKVFASAPINFPELSQTVFADVSNVPIRTSGKSSLERDRRITNEFLNFIAKDTGQKPFFSFLFYDTVHNYCENSTAFSSPFKPAINSCDRLMLTRETSRAPYLNRYLNSVHDVDAMIGEVLHELKVKGLLENSVILVTADHGEEINDGGRGYWVHASAYTKEQLHVPFLLYWPGMKAQNVSYWTTHYDWVPTVMNDVLGCHSPISDYSLGHSLFQATGRDYWLAGSYGDWAIVTPQSALRLYPDGGTMLKDLNGKTLPDTQFDVKLLPKVQRDLTQFE